MNTNYQYFLVLAEELNISRAARRLYISQQCLSNHLHRLEVEMNSVLFIRKPIPRLTPAGEALVRYLETLQRLENNIHDEIDDLNNNSCGLLNIGIHASRARILMPLLMESYGQQLTQIKMNISDGMTDDFQQKLQSGELDAFIGLNPSASSALQSYCLMQEDIYLAISDSLLRRYFKEKSDEILQQGMRGVNIQEFQKIPFIINHQSSNLTQSINEVLKQTGVGLNVAFQVNGNDMHIDLSSMDMGACFVPQMFIPYVEQTNQRICIQGRKLHCFPLNGFSKMNRLCLVSCKNTYMFSALKVFLLLTQRLFEEKYNIKQGMKIE